MGFKLNLTESENHSKCDINTNNKSPGIIGLNFANISSQNLDFQSEFLQHYDEFSPSWRKEVEKMNKRK